MDAVHKHTKPNPKANPTINAKIIQIMAFSSKPVDGDLAKSVTHESDESWPTLIEIVAYFGKDGRKGKRVSVEIDADQFFGRKGYGAPMSGDQMIRMVEKLRRG